MRTWTLLLAGLLLAASLWFVLAAPDAAGTRRLDAVAPAASGPRPADARPVDAGALTEDGAATRVEEAVLQPEDASLATTLPEVVGPAAWLHVRLVDGRGEPAAGARVDVSVAVSERGRDSGEDDDPLKPWRDPLPMVPDADGRVALRVPAGLSVSLEFAGPLWGSVYHSLQALRPEEDVDLGEVALTPASRLHGLVRGDDGTPIAGAQLTLQVATASQWYGGRSWSTTSDEDGAWQVEGMPAGRFRFEADAPGYASFLEPGLEIDGTGVAVSRDVVLHRGRSVRGMVLDADRNPVAGARIYLLRSPEQGWWGDWRPQPPEPDETPPPAVSGADGSFQVAGWSEDGRMYLAAATAEGFDPGHADVEDPAAVVVVTLTRYLRIAGRIVDREDDSIAGATVSVLQPSPWGGEPQVLDSTESGVDGAFTLSPQPAGEYLLSVSGEAGMLAEVPLPLESDREDLLLTPEPGSDLVVVVRDTDGAPIADAVVRVQAGSHASRLKGSRLQVDFVDSSRMLGLDRRARTDADGEVRFTGVPAGTVSLSISAAGFQRTREEFERASGEQQREIVLQTGAGLVVLVSDPGGAPVRGLPVALKHAGDGEELGGRQTDSAGRAVWTDLAPGAYLVAYRAQDAEGGWWRSRDNEEVALDHPLIELVAGETAVLPVQVGDLALATVVVHRRGEPASGVLVRMELVEDEQNNRWADANRGFPTDGRGEVDLPPLEPGTYDLVVKPSRDAPASRQRVELRGGAQRLEFALQGAPVRGRLLGTGGGLAGARLSLLPAAALEPGQDSGPMTTVIGYGSSNGSMRMQMGFLAEMQSTTRSGSDGTWEFRDVPDGEWVVISRAEGYGTWTSLPFAVRSGAEVRLPDQRMLPGAVVYGRDLGHEPAPESAPRNFYRGEQVSLLDEHDQAIAMTQLGTDGEYRLEDLPAGEYRIRKRGWISQPFRVTDGESKRIDIPLPEEKQR